MMCPKTRAVAAQLARVGINAQQHHDESANNQPANATHNFDNRTTSGLDLRHVDPLKRLQISRRCTQREINPI